MASAVAQAYDKGLGGRLQRGPRTWAPGHVVRGKSYKAENIWLLGRSNQAAKLVNEFIFYRLIQKVKVF